MLLLSQMEIYENYIAKWLKNEYCALYNILLYYLGDNTSEAECKNLGRYKYSRIGIYKKNNTLWNMLVIIYKFEFVILSRGYKCVIFLHKNIRIYYVI